MRTEAEGEGALLLRTLTIDEYFKWGPHTTPPETLRNRTVYRYEPGAVELKAIDHDAWERATGRIVDFYSESVPADPFQLNSYSDVLTYRGAAVKAAGRVVMNIGASPVGDLIGVYSGEGPRKLSVAPFIGKGPATGRHFHELYSKADGKPRGTPISLPFTGEHSGTGPYWSADGRYIVYNVLTVEVVVLMTDPTLLGD